MDLLPPSVPLQSLCCGLSTKLAAVVEREAVVVAVERAVVEVQQRAAEAVVATETAHPGSSGTLGRCLPMPQLAPGNQVQLLFQRSPQLGWCLMRTLLLAAAPQRL